MSSEMRCDRLTACRIESKMIPSNFLLCLFEPPRCTLEPVAEGVTRVTPAPRIEALSARCWGCQGLTVLASWRLGVSDLFLPRRLITQLTHSPFPIGTPQSFSSASRSLHCSTPPGSHPLSLRYLWAALYSRSVFWTGCTLIPSGMLELQAPNHNSRGSLDLLSNLSIEYRHYPALRYLTIQDLSRTTGQLTKTQLSACISNHILFSGQHATTTN